MPMNKIGSLKLKSAESAYFKNLKNLSNAKNVTSGSGKRKPSGSQVAGPLLLESSVGGGMSPPLPEKPERRLQRPRFFHILRTLPDWQNCSSFVLLQDN
jgi:hypothetical protein